MYEKVTLYMYLPLVALLFSAIGECRKLVSEQMEQNTSSVHQPDRRLNRNGSFHPPKFLEQTGNVPLCVHPYFVPFKRALGASRRGLNDRTETRIDLLRLLKTHLVSFTIEMHKEHNNNNIRATTPSNTFKTHREKLNYIQ